MTFEYPKDIIKKHMQEGLFWLFVAIGLFAIFFFCNFNYGAFKGTSTASLKAHHIGLENYWYAIIGMIIVIFATPKLKAAINRKITKYEIANSGVYVISTLNNSRAVVRWKDITGLIEDLDKISIVYDTKKLIIYSDLDMFEKFRAFIENNLTKAVRDKLNFKKKKKEKLSKEEEARRAELAKIEKEKEEKKKNTRMLLDQVLEDDSAKPNAIRKTEEERDAELSAVPKKLNQDFKSNKDSASGDSKGSLINAFLSGANEEETTKVSKSTMVMSKSVFKELTKKALAKRNRENAVSDSELNENTSNVENNDEEQELEPTRPMGGLRSRINKSTLKKDKSSILLSSIANQEEEKSRKEKERVEFSLDRLIEADSAVDKQEQKVEEEKQKEEKQKEEKQRKSNLLSEFLTTGKLGADVLKKFGGDKVSIASEEDKKVDLKKETVIQPVEDISKDFGQFEKEERSRQPITSKSIFGQEETAQPSFVQEQPVSQEQSIFGQEEPPQPSFIQEQPVSQGQSLFDQEESLQPSFVQEQPVSQGQSLFGQEEPPQPSFIQEQPVSQGQSLFGQEEPPQPSFVQEQPVSQGQSLFGQEEPPQPSFVQEQPLSQGQSLFGQEEPSQPSFVQEQPVSQENSFLGQLDISQEFGQFEKERAREPISAQPLFAQEEKTETFSQDLPAFVHDKPEFNKEELSIKKEESLVKSDMLKGFDQDDGGRKRESLVNQSDEINKQPSIVKSDISKDFANFEKERSRESITSDRKDNDLYGTSLIEKEKAIPNVLAITDEVLSELAVEKGEQHTEQIKENKEGQRDIRKSFARRKGRKTKTDIPKKIALNTNIVEGTKEVINSSISDKDVKNFKKSNKNKKFEKLTLDLLNSKTKEEIEQEILQKQAEERAKEEARLRAEEEERKKIADEEALKEKQRDLDIGKTVEMSPKKETLKHVDYNNVDLNSLIRPTQSGKLPELGKYILPTPSGHLPDLNSLIKPTQSGKLPDLSNIVQPTPSGHLPDLNSLIANLKSKKKTSDTPVEEVISEKDSKPVEEIENSDGRYRGEDFVDRKRTMDIRSSTRETMEISSEFANITNVEPKEDVNEISNSSKLPDLNSLIKPTYSSKLPNLNDLVKPSQPRNQVSEQVPNLNDLIRPSQPKNQISEQVPNLNDLIKPSQPRNQVSEQVPNLNDLIKPSQSGHLPDLNELIKPTQSGHLPDLNDLIKPTQSGHLPDLAKYINPTPSGHLPDLNELIQPTQSGHLPDLNSLLNNSRLSNIKKNKTNDDSNFEQENTSQTNLMDNVKTIGSNNNDSLSLMNKSSRFKRKFRNSQSQELPKLEDLLGNNVDRQRGHNQSSIDGE